MAAIETLDCANMAICTIGTLNLFCDLATRTVDCGTAKPINLAVRKRLGASMYFAERFPVDQRPEEAVGLLA